jgi:hypothetical protein
VDFDFGKVFSPQYLPALATAFSSGLKASGLFGQGRAVTEAASRRQQAAEFEAAQLRINAGQAKAASQRDAYFKGLEGQRLLSAIQARAGASGTDPTVLNIMAGAMAQKSYNMQAALYGGEEKARLFEMQAKGKQYDAALGMADARSARGAYRLAAVGTLAEGGASLFKKYWPQDQAPMVVPEAERPQVVGDFNTYGPDVDWTQ